MATEPTPLERAQNIARRARLKIVGKRNARGNVQEWRVFREMPGRLVFVGARTTEAATLALVEKLAQ